MNSKMFKASLGGGLSLLLIFALVGNGTVVGDVFIAGGVFTPSLSVVGTVVQGGCPVSF